MFSAMMRWPVPFDGLRCLVSPQPVTTRLIVEHRLTVMGSATASTTSTPSSACAPASGSSGGSRRSGPGASADDPADGAVVSGVYRFGTGTRALSGRSVLAEDVERLSGGLRRAFQGEQHAAEGMVELALVGGGQH